MIALEVNNINYENFISAQCGLRLDALSRVFEFEVEAPQQYSGSLPFSGGDQCRVFVDGALVITGYIEVIEVSYDSSSHSISILGRDKTGDLLDSTIGAIPDLSGENLTLKKLAENVIASIGLDIAVIDEVDPEPFSVSQDISAPDPGDNAFQFIEKHARKRQVLLTSNEFGNIVIASNSATKESGVVQNIIGAKDNNVISAEFSYDATGRFNTYKVLSSLNPVTLNNAGDTSISTLVEQGGKAVDISIREGRQFVIISESSVSSENCEKRAKWEADIRRARGVMYGVRVSGFRGDKNLWAINRLYQVNDDFVGVSETLLCNTVTFNYDLENGSTTDIGFVGKDSYNLFTGDDSLGGADVA